MSDAVFRVLPHLDEESAFFWTSGRDGKLRLLRCGACASYLHPPAPVCGYCYGRSLAPEVVSGNGSIHSFTINHQPWDGSEEPYVIAVVELDEQQDVRLTTNLVSIDPAQVAIGQRVRVVFENHDPVFLPLFEVQR